MDPEVQKALEGLKKVDEAIDKAKAAKSKSPPDTKGAIEALEEAEKLKRKVMKDLPDVLGVSFEDWHDHLFWLDWNLFEAIRILAGGTPRDDEDHLHLLELQKHDLEKRLKEAGEEKDAGK